MVKIGGSSKIFVSFSDPKKLLLLLLCIFHIWYLVLFDSCLLAKGNKICVN